MNIREITKSDLEACSTIFSRVFSSPPWSESWTVSNALQRLSHFYNSEGFIGLLAEEVDVLGFVIGNSEPYQNDSIFYLREMCTDIDHQTHGIGSELIVSLDEKLKSLTIQNIYLATDMNIPAVDFYTKNGFSCEAKMAFYSKHVHS